MEQEPATPPETAPSTKTRTNGEAPAGTSRNAGIWPHIYLWGTSLVTAMVLISSTTASGAMQPGVVTVLLGAAVIALPIASVLLARAGDTGLRAGLLGVLTGTAIGLVGLYEWARTSANADALVIFGTLASLGLLVLALLLRRAQSLDPKAYGAGSLSRRIRVIRLLSLGGIATAAFGAYQFWYEAAYVPSQLPYNVVVSIELTQQGRPATQGAPTPFRAVVKVTNSSPSKVLVVGDWYDVAVSRPLANVTGSPIGPPATLPPGGQSTGGANGAPPAQVPSTNANGAGGAAASPAGNSSSGGNVPNPPVGAGGAASGVEVPASQIVPPLDYRTMIEQNDTHSVMGRFERASATEMIPWRLVQSGELAGYGWWFEPGEEWSTTFVVYVPGDADVVRVIAGMHIAKGDRLELAARLAAQDFVTSKGLDGDVLREVRFRRTQRSFLSGFIDVPSSLVVAWVGTPDGMWTQIMVDDAARSSALDLGNPRDIQLIGETGLTATYGSAESAVCTSPYGC